MMKFVLYLTRLLPDKLYLQLMYRKHFGHFMSFKNPKSYNEKIQWLKINYRKRKLVDLVDKVKVKEIISNELGNEFIIETYGTWSDANKIDWEHLPDKYVLKCNHDSHCVFISNQKNSIDKEMTTKILSKRLKYNLFGTQGNGHTSL